MRIKLLTDSHLEVLSLKGGSTGWSESTLVKMPHCWKSKVTAQLFCPSNSKYITNAISLTVLDQSFFKLYSRLIGPHTAQSIYKVPHYNTDIVHQIRSVKCDRIAEIANCNQTVPSGAI